MKTIRVLTLAAVSASFALVGCESTKGVLGLNKTVPDEFRVVTKAPLVVPPDYALRPPAPGEPRPQELQPESAARNALLGERRGLERTEGEKLLTAKAGADRADPLARYVVDDEEGSLAYKDKSFADRVMFWKKSDSQVAEEKASLTQVKTAPKPEGKKGSNPLSGLAFWEKKSDKSDAAPSVKDEAAAELAKLPKASQTGANESSPVDAAAEADRLKALTGGKPIIIARQKSKFKLPGL